MVFLHVQIDKVKLFFIGQQSFNGLKTRSKCIESYGMLNEITVKIFSKMAANELF